MSGGFKLSGEAEDSLIGGVIFQISFVKWDQTALLPPLMIKSEKW